MGLKELAKDLYHNVTGRPNPEKFVNIADGFDEDGNPTFWGQRLGPKEIRRISRNGLSYTIPYEKLSKILFMDSDKPDVQHILQETLIRNTDANGGVRIDLPPLKVPTMTPDGPKMVPISLLSDGKKVGVASIANVLGNLISIYQNGSGRESSPNVSDQLLNQVPQVTGTLFRTAVGEQTQKLYQIAPEQALNLNTASNLTRGVPQSLGLLSTIITHFELKRQKEEFKRKGIHPMENQNGIGKVNENIAILSGVLGALGSLWCGYEGMKGERELIEQSMQNYLSQLSNQDRLVTAALNIRQNIGRQISDSDLATKEGVGKYFQWVQERIQRGDVYDQEEVPPEESGLRAGRVYTYVGEKVNGLEPGRKCVALSYDFLYDDFDVPEVILERLGIKDSKFSLPAILVLPKAEEKKFLRTEQRKEPKIILGGSYDSDYLEGYSVNGVQISVDGQTEEDQRAILGGLYELVGLKYSDVEAIVNGLGSVQRMDDVRPYIGILQMGYEKLYGAAEALIDNGPERREYVVKRLLELQDKND